ncbi:four-carbon acid sugar kinase family protein [Cupriavidus sp. SZY C1]|uniref:3-oxo-tetronate kinase n=1 Tax=Cupriavidus sp. SZY C1 TaxID=3055037 RepID=UPI0028B46A39|nr:3-oxo-tetronate kinase [Cupriavidus sp. SZY C1]MDT6964693.1 four-carbon acid sugar kinase family protein [Cupriavidus sp. SZY C1]
MSNRPLLGCIADDFTGATDLANTLVRNGMRTVQTIGVPVGTVDADAVVVALKSRTIPADDAVAQSLAALEWLRAQGCRQFVFKYCSTFDSTDAGNIGPVAEALLGALGSDFTIACPAFPENGRTIFRGHLFVADTLLSESGMEHHPLTPMTDANLVRVLQRQSQAPVGLLRYDTVAGGAAAIRARIDALRGQGVKLAIADAISDADLLALGEGCAALPLITGGSGIALGLPENFRRAGLLPVRDNAAEVPAVAGPGVVLAGSASRATNGQVARWIAQGRPAMRIDPLRLARQDGVVDEALALAAQHDDPVLIYATAQPDEVKAVQAELGVARAGELVEHALASIAAGLKARGTRRFVVAGGETSGAVVQALGVQSLRIGRQIAPGVPATVTLDDAPLALALKSGNFGGEDFFDEALRALGAAA